jgi:AGCS family alanine or glycine:cation symporter
MLNFLNSVIDFGNNLLWGKVLIAMLIVLGLYFSVGTKFAQFRLIKEMFKLLTEGVGKKNDSNSVSSFQAFCISTASRVGTGNLAGVALAIAAGGPGAVFWMWLIALIGAASSFVESTLAQIYKVQDGESYRGGPAYYMEKALGMRWLGIIFSILITICFGLVFNSVQSNTISFAFEEAFGLSRVMLGVIITVMTAVIIFGGVNRIAKVSEIIVPIMASAYVLVAIGVVLTNLSAIPEVFSLIMKSAFTFESAGGGLIGVTVMQGIKRGLFSNEAGMGSAPNAAATAEVSHPAKQGLIQTLGVFTDTILICSATAFMILLSGAYTNTDLTGIQLTQNALSSQVGAWGSYFIALCIFLFAFSSIIGNYYYGETNIEFITQKPVYLTIYRIFVVGMVMFGSLMKVSVVWNMADLFMGLMAILNLFAITLLSKIAFATLTDYTDQLKEGINPVFRPERIPGLKNADVWTSKTKNKKKNVA